MIVGLDDGEQAAYVESTKALNIRRSSAQTSEVRMNHALCRAKTGEAFEP